MYMYYTITIDTYKYIVIKYKFDYIFNEEFFFVLFIDKLKKTVILEKYDDLFSNTVALSNCSLLKLTLYLLPSVL